MPWLCAAAMLLAACGGGDDESTETTIEPSADATTEPSSSDDTSEPESDGDGDASAIITIDDGVVYELVELSSCDTSATDPSGLPIATGYDVTGWTADRSIRFSATRAGFDEDGAIFAGLLEGGFDADGKNASMLYSLDGPGLDLVVDGATISGTIGSKAITPDRPHGDTPLITVDVRC